MAAVIGSIKEDGSDGGGADVSGREEEREELVGDSTRLHGCRSKRSKARREDGERAGPEAANDDETAGTLGKGGGPRKTQRSSASEEPARANGGAAG